MADITAIAEERFRPIVESAGYILEEVTLTTIANERFLSVIVDHDTSINLDEVTEISRAISADIDEADPFGDLAFTLEVTTPGIDRPLTQPRHWRKNLNRIIRIVKVNGDVVEGRMTELTDDFVNLTENIKGRMKKHTVSMADVKKAVVQVEFKHHESLLSKNADSDDETGIAVEELGDSEFEEFEDDEEFESDEELEEDDLIDVEESLSAVDSTEKELKIEEIKGEK